MLSLRSNDHDQVQVNEISVVEGIISRAHVLSSMNFLLTGSVQRIIHENDTAPVRKGLGSVKAKHMDNICRSSLYGVQGAVVSN